MEYNTTCLERGIVARLPGICSHRPVLGASGVENTIASEADWGCVVMAIEMDLWSVPADFICLSGCLAALFWRGRVRELIS